MVTNPASPGDSLHLPTLVARWSDARTRTFLAVHVGATEPDPTDLFTELAYGTRIAQEVTIGRWTAVAALLRIGGFDSWAQVADAMGITEAAAFDGFRTWITDQARLRSQGGTVGVTEPEAAELRALAEAVAW
ncbi:hypothetical protein ACPZ19_48940 [Amycolatopsis lurida]